jgi:uncharacterized protein with HEPN domain
MIASDLQQIQYMLEAAHAALVFAEGKTQEKLFADTRLVFALVKALDLLGDAAAKVSAEGRAETRQVNWAYILSLPRRVYHNNDDINLSVVWDTVTNELPTLTAQLQHIRLVHQRHV